MVSRQSSDEALLAVSKGGVPCVSDQDCDGYGTCRTSKTSSPDQKTCHCQTAWTGPTCLAHATNGTLIDGGLSLSGIFVLLLVLVILATVMLFAYFLGGIKQLPTATNKSCMTCYRISSWKKCYRKEDQMAAHQSSRVPSHLPSSPRL